MITANPGGRIPLAAAAATLAANSPRMASAVAFPSKLEYYKQYGITTERLRQCKKDIVVMHPGPINRGVEMSSDVADGKNSVILDQVTNGIAVRMAVLYLVAHAQKAGS